MSIELKPVNGAWHIVDTAVPGWKTLETHGNQEVAEARLAAMLGKRPALKLAESPSGRPEVSPEVSAEPEVDPLLMLMLEGGVRDVMDRVKQTKDRSVLEQLEELERKEYGRNTVLKAIKARLKALR
jgi:hypothetical protein